jgi:spermidine synthase
MSSYLLGNSVLHFSLTIGLFMFFMGIGSYFSKYVQSNLIQAFVWVELLVGILGGLAVLLMYFAYAMSDYFYLVAFLITAAISICIGFELPIAARIIKAYGSLRESLAHILSFDYLGALAASILFPLVLLPYLGLMKTGFLIGAVNVAVALANAFAFRSIVPYRRVLVLGIGAFVILGGGFYYSLKIQSFVDQFVYEDPVIFSKQTSFQKIVLTSYGDNDTRLYLDGNLQFSTADEYRYHEPLVHYPLSAIPRRESILVLGGGDGIVVRELLRYPEVKKITLVDLDPTVIELASSFPLLQMVNQHSLKDSRVRIVYADAFSFVQEDTATYDAIIADLPDPNNPSLGKLYTREFYHRIQKRLNQGGVFSTQASSPFFARKAFWCIEQTVKEVFGYTKPFTVHVPSFGEWGFVMAANFNAQPNVDRLPKGLRFLNSEVAKTLGTFPDDMSRVVDLDVNRLDNQALVSYYEESLF